ncbi:unnamed protein product, partial [Ixodes persulcatus]
PRTQNRIPLHKVRFYHSHPAYQKQHSTCCSSSQSAASGERATGRDPPCGAAPHRTGPSGRCRSRPARWTVPSGDDAQGSRGTTSSANARSRADCRSRAQATQTPRRCRRWEEPRKRAGPREPWPSSSGLRCAP